MRLLDGVSRAGAVRLVGVLVASAGVATCWVGVSSATSESVIRTIPVGEHPRAVSSDGTHVWVVNAGEATTSVIRPGTVSEIEASSGTVIRTIHLGLDPRGVSSDGTHVWVTVPAEGTVSEIEASSGTVIRTIHLGLDPTSVSSDGTHVWVTTTTEKGEDGMVSEIEASSGTVVRTIHVGGIPEEVSSDGTHVWVPNAHTDRVSEIQASSGTVIRTIPVGAPTGVSSDGTHVWVANCNDAGERVGAEKCERVSEIQASSGTVIRTIHLGGIGEIPGGVSSDGTHVWVTNEREDTVSEIEASNGTVIHTIHVGSRPVGVSSDGTHVWVTNLEANTVSEIPISYTAAKLPLPKLAVRGNLTPVSGSVLVKLPGSSTFVALTAVGQIPFGTVVDATHGSVSVTTVGPHGTTQTITLSEGEFVLTQSRNGMVVATLAGGDFSRCPTALERAHIARSASTHAAGKHVVRKLWAEGHGNFTTDGNYASASVRGTRWLTEDLCEGTLVHVATDRVAVTNRVNHRHLIVKAGHSYLAKAP
jgi:YVTN family beta-propeller protein